jgi:hypothetical protein
MCRHSSRWREFCFWVALGAIKTASEMSGAMLGRDTEARD